MKEYKKEFPFPVLYPPTIPKNSLAEWLSTKGLKQFHCAETEKYAHVTFFFNGGLEKAFEGEERCMVPSPKVPTYDLKPEMSAEGVGEAVSTCTCNLIFEERRGREGRREERGERERERREGEREGERERERGGWVEEKF